MDEYQMIGDYLDMAFEDSISGYILDEGQEDYFYTEEEELDALALEGWEVPDSSTESD